MQVVIDLLLRVLTRVAEGDRCLEMFVSRFVGELTMFGAVAITLLILSQALGDTLEHSSHVVLEFVDVFCSVGACLLIAMGIWCNVVLFHANWLFRTKMSVQLFDFLWHHASSSSEGPSQPSRGFVDFTISGGNVLKKFHERYGIHPRSFDFGEYVRQGKDGRLELTVCSALLTVLVTSPPVQSWER